MSHSYVDLLFCPEKRESNVDRLEAILDILDISLDTKRKRHIVGGILVSASLLFGGLALTVLSLKTEDINETYIE